MKTILEGLESPDCEISILLIDDEQIQEINRDYLGRNRPTNVISFPMTKGEFSDINPYILGDVVISVETAENQARESKSTFDDMMDFLLIHGILHLLGYDHERSDAGAQRMEKKEAELLYNLNVSKGGIDDERKS
ncbi:MAG: rRNA maturation RNase YbeY [Thermodesulfobacteriota bacterium]|nr:rRNA maturation RNase YbeY [Thermodesulfobacteriota bacterium]